MKPEILKMIQIELENVSNKLSKKICDIIDHELTSVSLEYNIPHKDLFFITKPQSDGSIIYEIAIKVCSFSIENKFILD